MKKFFYESFVKISLYLMHFAFIINGHYLCAVIIWLNLRKSRDFKYKRKIKKKVIIFPKSGGNQDLIETFKNRESAIEFFLLPRIFLQKIFLYHYRGTYKAKHHSDYNTKPKNPDEMSRKKKHIIFLTSTFGIVDSFLKFDGIISFNLFYFGEKYLDQVCLNLKKKFVVLHKESMATPFEESNAPDVYGTNNEKSLAYKISVYSKTQKKIIIKSKIAKKKQVVIIGCPRADYAFSLRKTKPKDKIIIYYLIEYNRNINPLSNNSKINWVKLYNQTLNYFIQFARDNPDNKFILKGKIGVHREKHFSRISLPQNCTFVEGGSGEKYLRYSSVIIAFNSTIVYEAIASNRNLIIPNFNLENSSKKFKNHLLQISDKKYFVNTKNEFIKKLNFYINSSYNKKMMSLKDKKILDYYLGNYDGTSGKKMYKFLNQIFN